MPRSITRCPPKSTVDLDLLDELNCVRWIPIIHGVEFKTIEKLRACWKRHGGRILPHYIKQLPGTRPFALWALGELPLPPLKFEPSAGSLRVKLGETTIYSPWHYFGSRTGPDGYYCAGESWGEFQYLRKLGVIDDAEARLAEEWIDDRYYVPGRPYRDYKTLAKDE